VKKRTYGILILGTAIGAWCWLRYRGLVRSRQLLEARQEVGVVFDHTLSAEGII
jgi:hypothetical protein